MSEIKPCRYAQGNRAWPVLGNGVLHEASNEVPNEAPNEVPSEASSEVPSEALNASPRSAGHVPGRQRRNQCFVRAVANQHERVAERVARPLWRQHLACRPRMPRAVAI